MEYSKLAIRLGDDNFGFVICPYTPKLEELLPQNNSENLIYLHRIFGPPN
jgi:hypothetical protein